MTITRYAEEGIYRSSDLSLVASLCVDGFVIEEMERANAHRSVFIFRKSEELDEAVRRYWRSEMRIEPQAYFNQLKVLKARIYER